MIDFASVVGELVAERNRLISDLLQYVLAGKPVPVAIRSRYCEVQYWLAAIRYDDALAQQDTTGAREAREALTEWRVAANQRISPDLKAAQQVAPDSKVEPSRMEPTQVLPRLEVAPPGWRVTGH